MGGIDIEDMAGDQPVKQHAQGGQVLLHRGRREFALQLLDEGSDVDRLYGPKGGQSPALRTIPQTA